MQPEPSICVPDGLVVVAGTKPPSESANRVEAVESWFLDTNVWNYLHRRPDRTQAALQNLRTRLLEAERSGDLLVVGSLPLLQEVISTGRRDPELLDRMRTTILKAVNGRWLVPLNIRHAAEIARGATLSPTERYLPRETRRRVEALARRRNDVLAIADGTHAEVASFKEEQEAIRRRLLDAATTRDGLTRGQLKRDLEAWWETADVAGWIRGALRPEVLASSPNPDDLSATTAPSAWHFTRFKLARIRLNLGDGRAIKASDYVDAEHYAIGSYIDVLATDDGPFKETIELLSDCPFDVVSFADLERKLL